MKAFSVLAMAVVLMLNFSLTTSIPSTEASSPVSRDDANAREPCIPILSFIDLQDRESAGIAWGPVKVGNLKITPIKPHNGYSFGKFKSPGV
jgi:hypothetical protein